MVSKLTTTSISKGRAIHVRCLKLGPQTHVCSCYLKPWALSDKICVLEEYTEIENQLFSAIEGLMAKEVISEGTYETLSGIISREIIGTEEAGRATAVGTDDLSFAG